MRMHFVCGRRPHRTFISPHESAEYQGAYPGDAPGQAGYASGPGGPAGPARPGGPGARHGWRHSPEFGFEARGEGPGGFIGVAFGVRRPLRFLADKLRLDEAQVKEFARIIDELKIERAQSEVDRRRTVAAFADAVAGATFDAARAAEGADLRIADAQRLRGAVLKALEKIHALLDDAQREQLAYLIRTGALLL